MKLSPDDPRLTAYALGELPADEAARVEAELRDSPEAAAALEETRALAHLLRDGLAADAESDETRDVTEAVRRTLAGTPSPAPADTASNVVVIPAARFRWMPWLGLAAAAAILISAVSLFLPSPDSKRMPPLADSRISRQSVMAPVPTPTSAAAPTVSTAPNSPSPGVANSAPASSVPAPVTSSLERVATQPGSGVAVSASRERLAAPAPAPTLTLAQSARPNALAASAPEAAGPQPAPRQSEAQSDSYARDGGMLPETRKRFGLAAGGPAGPAAGGSAAPVAPPPAIAGRDSAPIPAGASTGTRRSPVSRTLASGTVGSVVTSVADFDESARGTLNALSKSSASADRAGAAAAPEIEQRGLTIAPLPPGMRPPSFEPAPFPGANNPGYVDVGENPFRAARDEPLSTFSLDVDTGSYANIRRFLNAGQFPRPDAVRLEEMINYFTYDAPPLRGDHAFAVGAEVAACPWAPEQRLVRLVIKARDLGGSRPAGNFVFLVDVSGSMQPPERLPLIKQALKALVRRLSPADRIAIVTYASSAGVHLPSTSGEERETILAAIDRLESGGSTNGEGGIRSAYDVARAHFIPGGVNRVLLCTDGDFNVGVSDQNQLVDLIAAQAKSGVFLTTLGVGTDNFKDALMRRLADRGNGSYHYLDSFEEAQRVLIHQMDATFVTVARDAKAQIEFNPAKVGAWRLLGYEKRILAHQDFNDDTKDAGEIGAGHMVTILYQIFPPGTAVPANVDPLKYQRAPTAAAAAAPARDLVDSPDLLTLKLRYQKPEGSRSALLEVPVADGNRSWKEASADFRFAAAVASFGMILRNSPNRGDSTLESVLDLARGATGRDPEGWRTEFLALVRRAGEIARGRGWDAPAVGQPAERR